MVFIKGVPIEEAEEGEVDDVSEPEDADSDAPSPGDGSRAVYNRVSKSSGTGTNLKSKVTVGCKAENRNGFQGSEPQKLDITNSNASYLVFDKKSALSISDSSSSVSQSTQTKLPPEEAKTTPNILEPGPYSNSASLQVQQIPLPAVPGPASSSIDGLVRHVGWPPNTPLVTPTGSQQEIEHMHQMYKKACELYDKAVEKIKSSGLNLPTSLLPRPPAPFTHLTIGNTINPGQRSTGAPGAIGATPISGLLLPPPPPLISPSQTSAGTGASPRPSDPKLPLIPPTPGAFSSDPAYKAAYASAYQQTMKAIPTPQAGGPTPDTPEFAATWQRYMDHYLRYYLRTNALSASNTKEKEQQLQHQSKQQQQPQKSPQQQPQHPPASEKGSDLAPKKDETLLPTTLPGNQTAESTVGLMPSNVADIALPPSPKRPRSTETTCATAAEQQTVKPLTADTAKDNQGVSPQSKQGFGQSETSKTGKTDESADLNESKYVWMSNLPQGVKAVDIKDRCTPFGRVQTIKIIGSRKSKPPSIYAYLIMETAEAAGRLIEGLQGTCFGNNQIKLKRITALPIP